MTELAESPRLVMGVSPLPEGRRNGNGYSPESALLAEKAPAGIPGGTQGMIRRTAERGHRSCVDQRWRQQDREEPAGCCGARTG